MDQEVSDQHPNWTVQSLGTRSCGKTPGSLPPTLASQVTQETSLFKKVAPTLHQSDHCKLQVPLHTQTNLSPVTSEDL